MILNFSVLVDHGDFFLPGHTLAIVKELQTVEETLTDVQKVKDIANKGLYAFPSCISVRS
jgi:hypothetical protein